MIFCYLYLHAAMKLTTLLFSFSFCLYNLSAQDDSHWEAYLAQYEKGPGSTLVNMDLKKVAPDYSKTFLFAAGVQFKNCGKEGLPAPLAFATLNKISDSIVALVGRLKKNTLAGTFTYQCERKDYFYVADTFGLKQEVTNFITKRFPGYTPAFLIKEDVSWNAYLSFLYPNEETIEYINNQKVLMQLQKAGDKLETPRQVDHWLYFKTEADRECFMYFAVNTKFRVEAKEKRENALLPFTLQISRTDKVDVASITQLTLSLRKEAKKCKGDYDGWETVLLK